MKVLIIIIILSLTRLFVHAQSSNEINPKNLLATLRNDTLFVHTDGEEFANFESLTPREIAYNKFRKINYLREKTIWFYYVVYDYSLFYVGVDKGGREIYETPLSGRIKYIPKGF